MTPGTVVAAFEAAKTYIVPNDQSLRLLVHLHGGLALFLLLAIVLRRPLHSMWPIGLVWMAEIVNEGFDLYDKWPVQHDWFWRDTASDLFNTLFWPTILFMFSSIRAYSPNRATETFKPTDNDHGEDTRPG